ncbi:MAG: hypothetical protein ABI721_01740 [Candidatus Dojkabacteria bacterium]
MDKQMSRRDFLIRAMQNLAGAAVAASGIPTPTLPQIPNPNLIPVVNQTSDDEPTEMTIENISPGIGGMITFEISGYLPDTIPIEQTTLSNPIHSLLGDWQNKMPAIMSGLVNYLTENQRLDINTPTVIAAAEIFPLNIDENPGVTYGNPTAFNGRRQGLNMIGGIQNYQPAQHWIRPETTDPLMTRQDWINYLVTHEIGHFNHVYFPSRIYLTDDSIIRCSGDNMHPAGNPYPMRDGSTTDIYPEHGLLGGHWEDGDNFGNVRLDDLYLFIMGITTAEEFNATNPYFISSETGEELPFTAEDIINTLDRRGAFDIFGEDRSYNENLAMMGFGVDHFTPGWFLDTYGINDPETGSRYLPINVIPIIFKGEQSANLYFDGDKLRDYASPCMQAVHHMQALWAHGTRNKVRMNIITMENSQDSANLVNALRP